MRTHVRRSAALGAALLAAGLLAGVVQPAPAHAALTGCSTDPVVTLSNGVTLEVNVSIQDALNDVTNVSYALDIPTGVTIKSVAYPDGSGGISSLTWTAQNTIGNYDDNTVVTTQTPTISMTAGQTATYGAPAQGHSGQTLHVHMHVALAGGCPTIAPRTLAPTPCIVGARVFMSLAWMCVSRGRVGATAAVMMWDVQRNEPRRRDCPPPSRAGAASGPDAVALTTDDAHRRSRPEPAPAPPPNRS